MLTAHRPTLPSSPSRPGPVINDTRAGLRINARCQVIDMNGEVIPGLYCGGEPAGGFSLHGLPRAVCQGFIAGRHAVTENPPA